MTYLVEDSRERGEFVSMLTASEGGIYPRFGYGVATRIASVFRPEGGHPSSVFRHPRCTLELVEPDRSMELAPPLFDRFRRDRVGCGVSPGGMVGLDEWFDADSADPKRRFDVVVRDGDDIVGHALYVVRGDWTDGFTEKVVSVRDLVAATDEAEAALWHYLLKIDQTVGVRAFEHRAAISHCRGCSPTRARCGPSTCATGCGCGRSTPPSSSRRGPIARRASW